MTVTRFLSFLRLWPRIDWTGALTARWRAELRVTITADTSQLREALRRAERQADLLRMAYTANPAIGTTIDPTSPEMLRAIGGVVRNSGPYLVGDRGPEVFGQPTP